MRLHPSISCSTVRRPCVRRRGLWAGSGVGTFLQCACFHRKLGSLVPGRPCRRAAETPHPSRASLCSMVPGSIAPAGIVAERGSRATGLTAHADHSDGIGSGGTRPGHGRRAFEHEQASLSRDPRAASSGCLRDVAKTTLGSWIEGFTAGYWVHPNERTGAYIDRNAAVGEISRFLARVHSNVRGGWGAAPYFAVSRRPSGRGQGLRE